MPIFFRITFAMSVFFVKLYILEKVKKSNKILTSDLLGEMSKHSSNFTSSNGVSKVRERISGTDERITCVESFSGAAIISSVDNIVKESL